MNDTIIKLLSGSGIDSFLGITTDGTYFYTVGSTYSEGLGSSETIISKWDSDLNLLIQKRYGTAEIEGFDKIHYFSGSLYAVANSYERGGLQECLIIRYDTSLNIVEKKIYGGKESRFKDITDDGTNIIVVGSWKTGGNLYGLVVKLPADLSSVTLAKQYQQTGFYCRGVYYDGSSIYTTGARAGYESAILHQINPSDFSLTAGRSCTNTRSLECISKIGTDIYISGATFNEGTSTSAGIIIKLNATFVPQARRVIGSTVASSNTFINRIVSDGSDIYAVGYTDYNSTSGSVNGFLLQLDSSLNVIKQKIFDSSVGGGRLNDIIVVGNDLYITGSSDSEGISAPVSNALLMKIPKNIPTGTSISISGDSTLEDVSVPNLNNVLTVPSQGTTVGNPISPDYVTGIGTEATSTLTEELILTAYTMDVLSSISCDSNIPSVPLTIGAIGPEVLTSSISCDSNIPAVSLTIGALGGEFLTTSINIVSNTSSTLSWQGDIFANVNCNSSATGWLNLYVIGGQTRFNIIPQERTVDPFAGYNSNAVNKITRIISDNTDCVIDSNPVDLSIITDEQIRTSTGAIIKDDVYIEFNQQYDIDLTDAQMYYEFGGNAFSEVGYYYIAIKYVYEKIDEAPEASVHIVLPSKRSLTNWNAKTDYVLIGVVFVEDDPGRKATQILNTDPTAPNGTVNYKSGAFYKKDGSNDLTGTINQPLSGVNKDLRTAGNSTYPKMWYEASIDELTYLGKNCYYSGGYWYSRYAWNDSSDEKHPFLIRFGVDRNFSFLRASGSLGGADEAETSGGGSWDWEFSDIEVGTIITSGNLVSIGPALLIYPNTTDGSDTAQVKIGGGGGVSDTRGAVIILKGNEAGSGADGQLILEAGDTSTSGIIRFITSNTDQWKITRNGDLYAVANGARLVLQDGGVTVPSLTFENDTDTGIYTDLANSISFTTAGTRRMAIIDGNFWLMSGAVFYAEDGSVTSPGISFNGDTDTGMWRVATNTLGFSTGGVERIRIDSDGVMKLHTGGLQNIDGSYTSPSFTFSSDDNTGFYRDGENTIGITCGNASAIGKFGYYGLFMQGGIVTSPSYSFIDDTNTGMYRITADTLGFSTGGVERLRIDSAGNVTFSGAIYHGSSVYFPDGAVASPSIRFANDVDTGMYRITTNAIGFTCAGTKIVQIDTGGVTITGGLNISGTSNANVKAFKIDHPLDPDNKYLIHTSIEGPQCDLIYRGKVDLVDGIATVDLDLESKMTPGTFDALNKDCQVWLQNDTGWEPLKGVVTNGVLNISCKDLTSTDTISWMVVGTRKDDNIIGSDLTDNNGDLITEVNK